MNIFGAKAKTSVFKVGGGQEVILCFCPFAKRLN